MSDVRTAGFTATTQKADAPATAGVRIYGPKRSGRQDNGAGIHYRGPQTAHCLGLHCKEKQRAWPRSTSPPAQVTDILPIGLQGFTV